MKHASIATKSIIPHRGGSTVAKKKQGSHHQKHRDGESKNLKFVSSTCSKVAEAVFSKLDPDKPEHVRRLQTRRRMISYGKNTVGYDEYLGQVPKDKRCPRSMETPSTPDYTLDIPNKRWVGQVRAWRRAIHSYDPPDLQTSLTDAMEEENNVSSPGMGGKDLGSVVSVKDRELAEAKSIGLQVQFDDKQSPTSVVQSNEMTELDKLDSKRNDADGFFSDHDASDDSDDDLL